MELQLILFCTIATKCEAEILNQLHNHQGIKSWMFEYNKLVNVYYECTTKIINETETNDST